MSGALSASAPVAQEVAPLLSLVGTQVVHGFVRGLQQASVRVQVNFDAQVDVGRCEGLTRGLEALPPSCKTRSLVGLQDAHLQALPIVLADFLVRLQLSAGWGVWSGAVVETVRPVPGQAGRLQALLLVPGPLPALLAKVVAPWVAHANALLLGREPANADMGRWVPAMARWAPGGTNNRHFLREAHAMGVPMLQLPGGVFQLGWGRYARLFKSSITDQTTAVGTAWAKDKAATNTLLRMGGLPVPEQRSVASLDVAVKEAAALGYPVVLKPVNLDQGLGVEADLRNEAELRAAYARSASHKSALILEKHVQGEDYRVYVVQGQLMAVAHRVPAQVTGDGQSTVQALVLKANEDKRQAHASTSVYKPITLDEEALALLSREGLDVSSVLPAGRVQRLRRSANSSRGGTSVDVTFAIHPDNAALCVQAAALLRLDIAGLDLLIPDIARSWRETGAAFCEVNAQPQMGGAQPWIFERILRCYLKGKGRIPTVLVLSDAPKAGVDQPGALGESLAQVIQSHVGATNFVLGQDAALYERCRSAVMRPDLGALVVQIDGASMAYQGLPLDRWDVLVVSQWSVTGAIRQQILAGLAPHVQGVAVVDTTPVPASPVLRRVVGSRTPGPSNAEILNRWLGPERVKEAAGHEALKAAVLQWVEALPDGA
jgi:cyanophycin synthetase